MFAKLLGLLLFFILAVSAAIPEATYFIYSGKSDTSIRSYAVGEPCHVSSTTENPGPYQLWEIKLVPSSPPGQYTIRNVGLDAFASAAKPSDDVTGQDVVTAADPTSSSSFYIESDDDTFYQIRSASREAVWTVELPIVPHGDIKFRSANGNTTQNWVFVYSRL